MPIAKTPPPPYYSVTTTVDFNQDIDGYYTMAKQLIAAAPKIDGFLGLEISLQADTGIAISYWQSLDAIQQWKNYPAHIKAKALGKSKWFKRYFTRIAKVEREY